MPIPEKPLFEIQRGALSGKIAENVFFRNAADQLARFWEITSLETIHDVDQLELPQSVHQYMVNTTNATVDDGKERACFIDLTENSYIASSQNVSKHSLFDNFTGNIVESVSLDTTPFWLWNVYFGTSHGIAYHTHPTVFADQLKYVRIETDNNERIPIDPEKYSQYCHLVSDIFSSDDLYHYLNSRRHYISIALGAPHRLVYVAPPTVSIPLGTNAFNRSASVYRDTCESIYAAARAFLFNLDPSDQKLRTHFVAKKKSHHDKVMKLFHTYHSLDDFIKLRDRALVDFCAANGLAAFASVSLEDPILLRIS